MKRDEEPANEDWSIEAQMKIPSNEHYYDIHLKYILKKISKMEKKKELDEKRMTQLEQQVADKEIEIKAVKDDIRQIRAEEEEQFRWMPALLALYNDMNRYKRNFANQEYAGGTPFKLVDFIFLPQ